MDLSIYTISQKKLRECYFTAKKEHAIIIETIEGVTNDDYIDALEKMINTNEIKFLSKISGKRICVFMSNESIVEELTNKILKIKEYALTIRPFMEKISVSLFLMCAPLFLTRF